MASTTSRWMRRSCAKTSPSITAGPCPRWSSRWRRSRVDLAGGDGGQHVADGREGDQLAGGQVGLAQQGLLGERAVRAEEADAGRGGHARTIMAPWTSRRSGVARRRALGVLSADDAVSRLRRLPFADLGFARVDHHRALRQGLPEAVYGPGKTPEQCAGIVGELLAGGGEPGDPHPGRRRAGRGGHGRQPRRRSAPAPHWCGGLGRAPGTGAGAHRRHRRPARWPTSASPPCAAHGFDATLLTDVGVAGRAPPAGRRRRAGRGRRRRGGRRHGGRAGQPGRRARRLPRWWPCPPASATAPRSRASPPCWPCSSSCASGVTVVGIDNGYGAACAIVRLLAGMSRAYHDEDGPMRTPGSTASPASPATWPSARLVDAGADLDEVRAIARPAAVSGWSLDGRARAAGGRGRHQGPRAGAEDTAVVRTYAHIPPWSTRLACRPGARPGPGRLRRPGRGRGRLHRRPPEQVHFHEVGGVDAIVDVVGTCAALEVLGVDRVTASPVATGLGMVRRPPTACCPTRRRRCWSCCGASPPTASTSPSS